MTWWIRPLAVFRIRAFSAWHDTRGIVLPLTFFILVLLAGLVAALLAVGATESQISANLLRTTQAFDLAEAGAERAMAAFVAQASLVGNATCSPCPGVLIDLPGSPFPALGSVGTYTVKYQPIGPSTVLVQSTGQSSIGTITQRVQVVVTAPPASSAFAVVGDDTELSGSAKIIKDPTSLTGGSVYGLTKTSLAGTAWVDQTATSSSSTCTLCTDSSHVGNTAGSGANKPSQALETKSALDYKQYADFVMQDDGKIWLKSTGVAYDPGSVPGCTNCKYWKMTSSTPGDWHYSGGGATPADGTYYSTQELSIDTSVGSSSTPWKATLLSGDATRSGELEINKQNGQNVYIDAYLTVNSEPLLAVAGVVVIALDHTVTATLTGTMISTTKSRSLPNCADNSTPPCDNGKHFPAVQIGGDVGKGGTVNLTDQLRTDGQALLKDKVTLTYDDNGVGGGSGAPQIVSWTRVAQ